jgi:hypothetical protein
MKPFTGGYVNAHLQNVVLDRNGTGLSVDGNGSNTGINVNIAGGSIASNTTGVLVLSTGAGAPVNVSMMRTQLSGNLQTALAASASNAAGQGSGAIRIGNSQITANAQGVSPVNGGQVISLGGNQVHSNSTNGAFTSSLPTQ